MACLPFFSCLLACALAVHAGHVRYHRPATAADVFAERNVMLANGGVHAATPFTLLPLARKTPYTGGVPHTNMHGVRRMNYSRTNSFLPLVLYHAVIDKTMGGMPFSAQLYKDAGFNTLHMWPGYTLKEQLAWCNENGLQAIPHIGTNSNASAMTELVRPFAADHAVLGWYLLEEPTGADAAHWNATFQEYLATKQGIKAVDTTHPIFNLDCSWTDSDGHIDPRPWWLKFNTDGDVSCHDNYPFPGNNPSTDAYNFGWSTLNRKQGITETVPLAVNGVEEKKPVWLTIQAFAQPTPTNFWFSMPTEAQMRIQAFAGIITGATGIIYFALDSWVTRVGEVVGIYPNASFSAGTQNGCANGCHPINASKAMARQSQLLWRGASALNAQLQSLSPAILSPTVDVQYSVGFQGHNLSATPIIALLKRDPIRGELVLITANVDRVNLLVQYSFDIATVSIPGSSCVHALFEGAAADTDGGGAREIAVTANHTAGTWSFVDMYEPFADHTYTL